MASTNDTPQFTKAGALIGFAAYVVLALIIYLIV